MNIGIDLAGVHLECPVMNAAGTCKIEEEVEILARSATAAIVVGSITVLQRESNEGEVFWFDNMFSLNSIGLRNLGMSYYNHCLSEMVGTAHKADKSLWVSVVGFSPDEYAILTKFAFEKGADVVELDLGCPNIWEGGVQKRITCFNPLLVKKILKSVKKMVGQEAKVVAKLSPFSDPVLLKQVAEAINQSRVAKAVTTTNTFPNALAFDERGRPRITPGDGLAGLGGPAITPIALGQVKQLRSFLPKNIDLIGVGGISVGKDILDFHLAGAKAVQICTVLLKSEPKVWPDVFTRLLIEFYEELKKRDSST